jgi:DNA-binding NarL/FixJ family response regulator
MNNSTPAHQGTVMIVDDTPANLAVLSDALQENGYRVLVATDGLTALEQLDYIKPDLILLDGMMPGIDGFETCRRIKANPNTANIPVLFMTALGDLDDLLRGFDEGAIDYIVKPFRTEEVLARVAAHLHQSRIGARVEEALAASGLNVLSINAEGAITWITPGARELLFNAQSESATTLPPLLHDFAMTYIRAAQRNASVRFQHEGIAARISECVWPNEFLLLLQKSVTEPSIDTLRSDLGLTAREAEVLMWISRGKTNRDIGEILGSSPRTVNKHLEHIFEKLGVSTRSAAVSVAMQRGA